MSKDYDQVIDSQIIAENVSFLDNCFETSFSIQSTLNAVKNFVDEEFNNTCSTQSTRERPYSQRHGYMTKEKTIPDTSESLSITCYNDITDKTLKDWGLPNEIVEKYSERGVKEMFDWQVCCLKNSKVLMDSCNLVYSAPTSAGKTLVAEMLLIKTVLERQKKVIVILPFVSIVREKMHYLQDILSSSGLRVEGFMGSQAPPGGLQAVHVAICTIEKANSLINRLLDEGDISDLGAVIVDELHLLGDPHRGYILELLLTKVKYVSSICEGVNIQIIGMSATLPNLEILSKWLDAELFITQFRPIPLEEYCLVSNQLYDKNGVQIKTVETVGHNDLVLQICFDTIKESCSILIFCMTKNWCENLAQGIASSFYKMGNSDNALGITLREQLKATGIMEVLEQLKNCPVGLDHVLKKTVSFGVAYHHAGLTFDERDIIEGGFKSGAIRVLVATSTLSSGVNLPARKVIIRSPVFQRQPINILTYKQMAGRAGRMGKDTMGESIIICTEGEKKIAFDLMTGTLDPVLSCINREDKYMRAILEVIASQVASTKSELEFYTKCTLEFCQREIKDDETNLLFKSLDELKKFELIRIQNDVNDVKYVATPLGKACLSSSMAPNDGLSLFCELQKARQCIVLETDLHLIYLVTPYSVSNQWGNIDWLHFLTLWETLPKAMKRVGDLVGVQEGFIVRCVRGANKLSNAEHKMNIHKRFYTALALQDLVNEIPLPEVANKFQCPRGFLQGLQQAAATFAGMVTSFCHQLGWKNMEMLFSQFQDRLHFGIHSELLELMRLPSLNGMRARSLFNCGFETISSIALADVNNLENALHSTIPFQSEKEREGDTEDDIKKRNKLKYIWVTGYCGVTTKEAAENLMKEARQYLEREIGVGGIKWKNEVILCDGKIKSESINIKNESPKRRIVKNETLLPPVPMDILTHVTTEENCDTNVNTNLSSTIVASAIVESDLNVTPKEILEETTVKNVSIEKISRSKNISEWDTLNLSETAIENISKAKRPADQVLSTNDVSLVILDDNERKNVVDEKCSSNITINSYKDVSLFSSDDNSSLFEDSLPLNLIPSKLLNINSSFGKNDNENEKSLPLLECPISDEENFTLYYERESDNEDDIINLSINSDEIESTQEALDITNSIKKIKISGKNKTNEILEPTLKCLNSKIFNLRISNKDVNCFYLTDEDVIDFVCSMNKLREFSLYFSVVEKLTNDVIGSKIFKVNDQNQSECELGIALFSDNEYNVYLNLNLSHENKIIVTRKLSKLFNKLSVKVRVLSTQEVFLKFKKYLGIELPYNLIDISLAEWLIDSDEIEPALTYMVKKYLDVDISNIFIEGTRKKYFRNFNRIEVACTKSWAIWKIFVGQLQLLNGRYTDVQRIIDIEVQVSKILANCAFQGINVDAKLSAAFLKDIKNTQGILQNMAYKICGYRFNFNSSKEVAKILGIYNGRKVSTKKSVLTTHQSPISNIIIYWRKLNAILSKTLFPLTANAVNSCDVNRIYPTYSMYTCSGRISMHEPNLQSVPRKFSIPVRFLSESKDTDDVIEFNCRNIFRATDGYILVSADYCQLEMRILTHYCKDDTLIKIMRSDVDVFKAIAASWSCVPEHEVDDDLRQKAKQLCYGVIYGIGNKSLSQLLDVSEMEASVFMDTFHRTYPSIRVLTKNIIDDCKKKGYIETLMKRRRYLPDINSKIVGKRNHAERQAVNTTIQGSAADIAKAAMVAISSSKSQNSRLLLQLHDELIYEVPEMDKDAFVVTMKQAMEGTVTLNIPLPVKVKCGYSWGTLEYIV